MRRGWLNRATMLSLALALFVTGCDNAPTGPDLNVPEPTSQQLTVPQVVAADSPVVSIDGHTLVDVKSADASQGLLGGLLRLVGQVLNLVIKVIGLDGGLLSVQGHSLLVPRGAVLRPTVFRMEVLEERHVVVDLTATRDGRDVGTAGFERPVELTLSYANVNVRDPSKLYILRINRDGSTERLPTRLDRRHQTISADLNHFSKYAMATN